jgi:thiamine biosynthesis lipoprotein
LVSQKASEPSREVTIEAGQAGWLARFSCFAGPCEVHLPGLPRSRATFVSQQIAEEAWRIESTYSRYSSESWLGRLNASGGRRMELPEEAARLFSFAQAGWEVSGGAFDISSGILRRAWNFHGMECELKPPAKEELKALVELVGWQKVEWSMDEGWVELPHGMELDLGGLGKEYAVDRGIAILQADGLSQALVNFGGDLAATGPMPDGRPWSVGIDNPAVTGSALAEGVELMRGALATSGDARRFLVYRGRRYGHLLDARTGWPPPDAPRSVSVLADTCSEAGLLASIALLMGPDAEAFLEEQGRKAWILRD